MTPVRFLFQVLAPNMQGIDRSDLDNMLVQGEEWFNAQSWSKYAKQWWVPVLLVMIYPVVSSLIQRLYAKFLGLTQPDEITRDEKKAALVELLSDLLGEDISQPVGPASPERPARSFF